MVWDLDTLIGFPVPVEHYLQEAFRDSNIERREYAPLFRVIDADEYVKTFSSDRSHMRKPFEEWIAPPPPWPAIMQKDVSTFAKFIDVHSEWIGELMTFPEFHNNFSNSPPGPFS